MLILVAAMLYVAAMPLVAHRLHIWLEAEEPQHFIVVGLLTFMWPIFAAALIVWSLKFAQDLMRRTF